jgi:hypothetical protein
MSNHHVVAFQNLVKSAQAETLTDVLAFVRNHANNPFTGDQLNVLSGLLDEYKVSSLTPVAVKGKKAAKADAAPRKPVISGYSLFSKEKRNDVVAANPGVGPTEVMSLLGKAWKALPPAEQEGFNKRAKVLTAEAQAAVAAPAAPAAPAAAVKTESPAAPAVKVEKTDSPAAPEAKAKKTAAPKK